MPAPIALQLYTLRDVIAQDFEGTIRQVAEMGYLGVETAGMYGKSPQDAFRLFGELGLQVCSAHMPAPVGDQKSSALETLQALGCNALVVPWLPPEEFTSEDKIKAVCDKLNEGSVNAREQGISLAYHNHHWEFEATEALGGRIPFQIMLENLDPAVQFEIDTYWVKVGGSDPVEIVRSCGARAPRLHIKDGSGNRSEAMLAAGDGMMDFPSIIAAGHGSTEWLIVELDRCDTDMVEAVRKSYSYLTGNGLAQGKS